jgi:hypothetical protein
MEFALTQTIIRALAEKLFSHLVIKGIRCVMALVSNFPQIAALLVVIAMHRYVPAFLTNVIRSEQPIVAMDFTVRLVRSVLTTEITALFNS